MDEMRRAIQTERAVKLELEGLGVEEILNLARERGYTVRQVDSAESPANGQFRIFDENQKNSPDLWMNAVNTVLRQKQAG